MDGQYRYEMNLKKNDLFINLSSDDVTFISRQMDQWCRILLNGHYSPPVRQAPPPPLPIAQPVPPVIVEALSPPPVAPAVVPVPAPEMTPAMTPPPPVPTPPPAPQALPEPVMVAAPPPMPVTTAPAPVAAAPVPMTPVPTTPSPLPIPAPVAVASPPLSAPAPTSSPLPAADPIATASPPVPQDDFEAVMDSVMRDLAQSAPEAAPSPALPSISASTASTLAVSASATLPFSTDAPTPDTPASLGDLCERAGTANVFDSLLLAALHLTHSEHQETFSLKRLNSALVKAGLTPVNHSVLEAALSAGVLAMVPDLTGTADVSEYRLTSEGLQSANALL